MGSSGVDIEQVFVFWLGQLLTLAEKEASVHVALAAHLWAGGSPSEAEGEWDRACVRMDAMSQYLADLSANGKVLSCCLCFSH